MWSSSAGLESHDWQPRSAQIEITSYVLLALFRRGSLVEGIDLMKWLSKQRNHLGGYGTTQVTLHLFLLLEKVIFNCAARNTIQTQVFSILMCDVLKCVMVELLQVKFSCCMIN